jgi:hypothetical protein
MWCATVEGMWTLNLAFGLAALAGVLHVRDWLRGTPSQPVQLTVGRVALFVAGVLTGYVTGWVVA